MRCFSSNFYNTFALMVTLCRNKQPCAEVFVAFSPPRTETISSSTIHSYHHLFIVDNSQDEKEWKEAFKMLDYSGSKIYCC